MGSALVAAVGLLLNLGAADISSAAPRTSTDLHCEPDLRVNKYSLPVRNPLTLHISVGVRGWLEIDEAGQEITVAPIVPDIEIRTPLRYGTRFISIPPGTSTVTIQRYQPNRAEGQVRVALRCSGDTPGSKRLEWLRQAQALMKKGARKLSDESLSALMAEFQELRLSAPDAADAALASHLIAQVLLVGERHSEASTAFATAQTAWLGVGEANRAEAALVGRAESLQRLGRYADVVDLVNAASTNDAASGYFPVRLQTSRCIAMDYLSKFDQSATCYEHALQKLDGLDERLDYVNTLQNYAIAQSEAGHLDRARRLAERALGLAAGPYASIVRGRAYLVLLDIDLAHADPATALAQADSALQEFVLADLPNWQARTLIKIAAIYRDLGSYDEAYLAISGALQRYKIKDAPASVAAALLVLASIDRLYGRSELAAHWSRIAVDIYSDLKMPQELEDAGLASLRMQLDNGDFDGVEASLATMRSPNPLNANARSLLEVELALRHARQVQALKGLGALKHRTLRLPDVIDVALLEAGYWRHQGDFSKADAILRHAMTGIGALAQSTGNRALRLLLARQGRRLRSVAFDALLSADAESMAGNIPRIPDNRVVNIDAIWKWLALEVQVESGSSRGATVGRVSAEAFDQTIAAELLAPQISRSPEKMEHPSSVQRELLSLLAKSEPAIDAAEGSSNPLALGEMQAILDRHATFLAFVDGGNKSGLLRVTRTTATVYRTAAPSEIRAATSQLHRLLRSAQTPPAELDVAERRLSSALFGSMAGVEPPHKLLVLVEGGSESVPWNVLSWPGHAELLMDTTVIELVRIARDDAELSVLPAQSPIYVVVADQQRIARAELPILTSASAEPQIIRSAASGHNVVASGERATREAVLSMLGKKGAWIHVAAHGFAQPSRIGYAGIWLEPAKTNETPPFLSWLDILGSDVRADLVVLNACQLGDSGDAINGNLSFASAVSQAGAKQVVASLWPVSDAASAVWVPAFYSALTADPRHDAAEALRAAQIKLRESRMFRDPFYWAGMQTFTRLSIVPAPTMTITKPLTKSKPAHSAKLPASTHEAYSAGVRLR